MEPNEKSENKIKEKLNLHVKKRLQESTKDTTQDKGDTKDKVNAIAHVGPRTKKQKTKNGTKKPTNTTGTVTTVNTGHGVKQNDLLLSPGAANSNDTTNSSINSTDQDGELNDRDVYDQTGSSDKPAKTGQRMDIFSCILNQKKSSLMRDPEVIAFLKTTIENKK